MGSNHDVERDVRPKGVELRSPAAPAEVPDRIGRGEARRHGVDLTRVVPCTGVRGLIRRILISLPRR